MTALLFSVSVDSPLYDGERGAGETASYCGACGATYSVAAPVARLCAVHAAARDSRLAAWRACGYTGAHYLADDEGESRQ